MVALLASPPPDRGVDWLDLSAEYRLRSQYMNPLELNGTTVREIDWTEQRGRIDLALKHEGWLRIRSRMDFLDGVLFGDNGRFGEEPSSISGVSLATKRPNNTTLGVGLIPGRDPLSKDSYAPRYRSIDAIQVEHLYAEAVLPFGLLRVGRQPLVMGVALGGHDGGRHNRWGVSTYGDTADRVLVATKLDEGYKVLTRPGHKPDTSLHRGLFLASFYDWFNHGALHQAGDTLNQIGVTLIWKADEIGPLRGVEVSSAAVHLGGDDFKTDIWAWPSKLKGTWSDLSITANAVLIRGESREISEGFAALSQKKPRLQEIKAGGAQAIIDYRIGPVTLTAEADYATGDGDPGPETPIESFSFPRDLNVGLFMFERILAFQSARSAEVGIENLRSIDSPSFPVTEVSTEGRFTNALALFPQVHVELAKNERNLLGVRLGALFAWPDEGLVDLIRTSLGEDGEEIEDDKVNYNGGAPGDYLGTELDLQLQWTYRERFVWTMEGAVLFPGNSMHDEHGDAVNAFFFENRFEYLF